MHWRRATLVFALSAAPALAMTAACSSGGAKPKAAPMTQASASAPAQPDTPSDEGGAVTPGGDFNPDGIPYPQPAAGYGRNRRMGSTPGSVMDNFKFLGYRNAVVSQQPERISLADYYDPCNTHYKLIHLSVASVWCVPCNQETDAVVAAKAQLDAKGVVVLQALDDGPVQGIGANQGDLNRWIKSHSSNFTEMLDPGLTVLAGFFDAAAVPWNCDLDPRTMEIVYDTTGWAGDVTRELGPSWAALPATPSYPLPVSCN